MDKRSLHHIKNKVKKNLIFARDITRVHKLRKELNKATEEGQRYYNERQILYDQSQNTRIFLANKYLKGKGIEIGPAEHPLPTPHWSKVTYVDEISTEELLRLYPYLKDRNPVHVDVVDDGQVLSKFKDNSQDFVIANHFLEHVIDPIRSLRNFYRVLKPGGIMYMAVPDKRFTFDKLRPLTPLKRLIAFHADPKKAEAGKWPMFVESAKWIEGKVGKDIKTRAQELYDQKFSVHLNVWTQHDLLELFLYVIRTYNFDLDFESVVKNEHEIIFVMQKQAKSNVKENVSVGRARKAHGIKK